MPDEGKSDFIFSKKDLFLYSRIGLLYHSEITNVSTVSQPSINAISTQIAD